MQVFADAGRIDPVNEFIRVVAVETIDKLADADVRRVCDTHSCRQASVATIAPVVVFHLSAVHFHNAIAGVNLIIQVKKAIVEGHQERHRFEY